MLRFMVLNGLFFMFAYGTIGQSLFVKDNTSSLSLMGEVLDGEISFPIVGAHITLLQKQKKYTTITDSAGEFSFGILPTGHYDLQVSFIGYKTHQQVVHLHHIPLKISILLHQDTCLLHEVSVAASRLSDSFTTITTSLGREDLIKNSGQSLGQVLKNISGVTTLNVGNTISKPVIHGLYGNRVLIMNAGLRQEGQQWGNEHAPEIDVFTSDSITVVKGASAVQYGADALGGVVLVEPRKLQNQYVLRGEANIIAMSNGRQGTLSCFVEGSSKKLDNLSWRIQGTLTQAGNYRTPDYYLYNTGFKEQNFSYHVGYSPQKYGVELFYSQFNTQIGVFSGAHIGNIEDLQYAISQNRPQTFDEFSYRIIRPYQHVEHELFRLKTYYKTAWGKINVIYGRQFNDRAEMDVRRTREENNSTQPDLHFKLTTHSLDALAEHQPIAHHLVGKIGLQTIYQRNTWDGTRYFIPYYNAYNVGFFLHENYKRCEHWEAEAGVRYDFRQMEFVLPRIESAFPIIYQFQNISFLTGFQYNFSENIVWKHQIGSAWRAPQVNELFSNGVHHGVASFEIGNQNLKAERGYKYTSSFLFQNMEHQLSVEITPYVQWIADYIYLNPTGRFIQTARGGFPVFEYLQNDALFWGGDMSATQQYQNFRHTVRFMYVNGQNSSQRVPLPLIAPWRTSWATTFEPSSTHKRITWQAGIEVLYVARQNRWQTDFTPPPAHYWLVNFEIGLKYRQIRLSLQVRNALNTSYRDYLNRFRYYADEQGRNFILRLHIPLNIIPKN